MVSLDRSEIKRLASNEITYNRGRRYYLQKAIKNISKSRDGRRYRAIVRGNSDYTVDINLSDKSVEYSCNCPSSRKHEGACKHIIAVLLFIESYSDKKRLENMQDIEKKTALQIIDYFSNLENTSSFGETYNIRLKIRIDSIIKDEEEFSVAISLSAGDSKLYRIQNIRKFLTDYSSKKTISLGREFSYVYGENKFDVKSARVLDFFCEILRLQEVFGKGNSTKLFLKSEIYLNKSLFIRLLKMIEGPFDLVFGDTIFRDIEYVKANPEIDLFINYGEDNKSIVLSGIEERIIPLDYKGSLFYYENKIFNPSRIFSRNILPFYRLMADSKNNELIFEGKQRERFLTEVLPKIHETFSINMPAALRQNYIKEAALIKLYIDVEDGDIRLEIKVQYGSYIINPLSKNRDIKAVIVREIYREEECIEKIENLGFSKGKEYFYIKNDEKIYEFLKKGINSLLDEYEIYYSKEFKAISLKPTKLLGTAVRISENLLELDFDIEDIAREDIMRLYREIREKKKFFKLRDGSFLDLTSGDTDKIQEILSKTVEADDRLRTPLNYLFYIDGILDFDGYNPVFDESFKKLINEVRNREEVQIELPKRLKATLREYQIQGYKWLKVLSRYNLCGILADDMGLGKTLQAIAYLLSNIEENRDNKTSLVVCPSSLLYNWQEEIEKFSEGLKVVILMGTPQERHNIIENIHNYDVVLVSYPIIRRDIESLSAIKFDTIFLDEAQYIKNPNSNNKRAVKRLKAEHRFAITGTPIENNLSELWSIFDFLMPGYLYSHSRFLNVYEKPIVRFEDEETIKKLNLYIQPFILRRMKKDVLRELPGKNERKIITDLTEEQRELYVAYIEEIRNKILKEVDKKGFEKSKIMILSTLTRLRQICCHPRTFIEGYEGGSYKLELLLELVENAIENGHRILVFSQFTSMLRIIEEEFKKTKIKYYYLDGKTDIEQRCDDIREFNSGKRDVYLISLKAGGTGLNLVGADTVIHFDPWWNPAVEEQATDRVYRIGQRNKVNVVRLLTKGTIEEKIYNLQEKKRNLADTVIRDGEYFINKLSKDEIYDLFEIK